MAVHREPADLAATPRICDILLARIEHWMTRALDAEERVAELEAENERLRATFGVIVVGVPQ